jgi:MFS family permease
MALSRRMHLSRWVDDLQPAERRLVLSFSILSLGTGLSLSLLAVYLVRYLVVGSADYGIGMSVAAFCGLVAGPMLGRLSDRCDRYKCYAALAWAMAVATASLAVASKWTALILLSVLLICGRGSAAVMGALIGEQVSSGRRVRYRAVVKTASTVTMLSGTGLGAIVLSLNSRPVFQAGFLLEAATLCAAGFLVLSLGRRPRVADGETAVDREAGEKRRLRSGVLQDRLFLALALLNGIILLYSSVPTIAFPLWIAVHARSLLWLVAAGAAVNMCTVVLLQVPMSRHINDVHSAASAARRGGLFIGISILLFPVAAVVGGSAAKIAILLILAIVLGIGEVLYSAGSWELFYALVPSESLGQYQGVFNIGLDVSLLLAPTLFAELVNGNNVVGWTAVAAVFIVCSALVQVVAIRRWSPVTDALKGTAEDLVGTQTALEGE